MRQYKNIETHSKSQTVRQQIVTMKPLLFALALVALATCGHAQTNYCDPVLCRTKGPHIACNGLATLAADCGPGGIEKPLDAAQQALVLDLHNRLRSKVASGQQNYSSSVFYPSAARMATLRWDNELAAIAAANVRRCQYGHDKCRNTPQYSNAGQNIANLAFQNTNYVDSDVIRDFINDWYSEYAVANPALMASYPKGYTGPAIGHFTQIVSDRCTAVGCAMVRYVDGDGWTNQNLVCNYAITQITSQPIYVAGSACSQCATGCNPKYPGLCNPEEKIFPKP